MSKQVMKLSLIEMYAIKHSLQANLRYKRNLIETTTKDMEYINMLKKDLVTESNLLSNIIEKIEQIRM